MEPLTGIAAWIRSLLQNRNQGDTVQDEDPNEIVIQGTTPNDWGRFNFLGPRPTTYTPGYGEYKTFDRKPQLGPGPGQTAAAWADENPDQADQYFGWNYNDWKKKIADRGDVAAPWGTWKGPVIGGSSLRPDFWGTPAERSYPQWQPDDEVPPEFRELRDQYEKTRWADGIPTHDIPAWGPDSLGAWKTFPTGDEWNRFNAERWRGHGGLNEETGLPTWIGDMPTIDPRTGLEPWQQGHPYYDKHHAKPDRLRRQTYYQER